MNPSQKSPAGGWGSAGQGRQKLALQGAGPAPNEPTSAGSPPWHQLRRAAWSGPRPRRPIGTDLLARLQHLDARLAPADLEPLDGQPGHGAAAPTRRTAAIRGGSALPGNVQSTARSAGNNGLGSPTQKPCRGEGLVLF
jgi:hypothetical protein